jgi:hypothetical protein
MNALCRFLVCGVDAHCHHPPQDQALHEMFAQWLAYALPCQRFANTLAGICA